MDTRFFTDLDLSHALFNQHRHHGYHYDAVISFPPGCGGNFLTVGSGQNLRFIDPVNCYVSMDAQTLTLDDIPWSQSPNLDDLHRLMLQYPQAPDPGVTIGRCHNLPWMTSSVLGIVMDELIVLGTTPEDSWFPSALNRIKWYCNRDWNGNPDMMYQLLQDAHHDGEVRVGEYHLLCNMVKDRFDIDCKGTVVSWKHYMRCKSDGIPLDDHLEFSRSMGDMVFSTLTEQIIGEIDTYLNLWRGSIYQLQLSSLRGKGQRITMVDYMDLMMDMQIPGHGYLSGINRDSIRDYSEANLALVRYWLQAASPVCRDRGMRLLDSIQARFDCAVSIDGDP